MKAELKDARLDWLADRGCNVAQFVSYSPRGEQRYCRVRNVSKTRQQSIKEAVEAIHRTQRNPSVNVRSFLPDKPEGNPFVYGLTSADDVVNNVQSLTAEGLFVIINETIDVADGGFSGVLFGDVMEVSPCDTPRCVDKPGTMALPRQLGVALIQRVYGFDLKIPFTAKERVEFSVHPARVGYLAEAQIVWQVDSYQTGFPTSPAIRWPNNYSRAVGDKAHGLLIASLLGLPVPYTTVLGRLIPPFSFGQHTDEVEKWLRTCPNEQVPGKFPTYRGWRDPFKMMQGCDPTGENVASVIIQDSVSAQYAGACVTDAANHLVIEGRYGYGDAFMVGEVGRDDLPKEVVSAVTEVYESARAQLGAIRFEWVWDGTRVWIVQLHVGATESSGNVIYPGEPSAWIDVQTSDGLEKLREVISTIQSGTGIKLHGNVGITSHFGDVLRKAKIPSVLQS